MTLEKDTKIERFHQQHAEWEETGSFDAFLTIRATYWDMLGSGYVDDRENALSVTPRMLAILKDAKQPIPNWISSEILLLLNEPGKLSSYLSLGNSEPLLAWYCCVRAINYSDIDKITLVDQFKQLIYEWTGKAIEPENLPTLDKVVDCLYGKTCWTLYGQSVDGDADEDALMRLANEIVSLGVPLAHRNEEKTVVSGLLPEQLA